MKTITVESIVNSNIDKVWEAWNTASEVQNWNHASDDWESPKAINDLKVNGRFIYTMSAKDKSFSFDFSGTYTEVNPKSKISFTMDDGRKVKVTFEKLSDNKVKISEEFDPESTNSLEKQQAGWQSIMDNFKRYVELKP